MTKRGGFFRPRRERGIEKWRGAGRAGHPKDADEADSFYLSHHPRRVHGERREAEPNEHQIADVPPGLRSAQSAAASRRQDAHMGAQAGCSRRVRCKHEPSEPEAALRKVVCGTKFCGKRKPLRVTIHSVLFYELINLWNRIMVRGKLVLREDFELIVRCSSAQKRIWL
jgi:hypothetical protein